VGKVPVILALGMKEVEARSVSLRRLGAEHQTVMPLGEAIATLAQEAKAPDLRG
jgi:threonyl-tRNA synthetase